MPATRSQSQSVVSAKKSTRTTQNSSKIQPRPPPVLTLTDSSDSEYDDGKIHGGNEEQEEGGVLSEVEDPELADVEEEVDELEGAEQGHTTTPRRRQSGAGNDTGGKHKTSKALSHKAPSIKQKKRKNAEHDEKRGTALPFTPNDADDREPHDYLFPSLADEWAGAKFHLWDGEWADDDRETIEAIIKNNYSSTVERFEDQPDYALLPRLVEIDLHDDDVTRARSFGILPVYAHFVLDRAEWQKVCIELREDKESGGAPQEEEEPPRPVDKDYIVRRFGRRVVRMPFSFEDKLLLAKHVNRVRCEANQLRYSLEKARHTRLSWQNHYRKNKADIDHLAKQLRRSTQNGTQIQSRISQAVARYPAAYPTPTPEASDSEQQTGEEADKARARRALKVVPLASPARSESELPPTIPVPAAVPPGKLAQNKRSSTAGEQPADSSDSSEELEDAPPKTSGATSKARTSKQYGRKANKRERR